MPNNCQLDGVFTFLEESRSKNNVNTDVFGASEAQHHRIYEFFFAPASKSHGIYNAFWTAPAIKGPDNPTSQLLPIMSKKCCTGDGEGRKDKGGGGGKMVCDKDGVVKDGVRQSCV